MSRYVRSLRRAGNRSAMIGRPRRAWLRAADTRPGSGPPAKGGSRPWSADLYNDRMTSRTAGERSTGAPPSQTDVVINGIKRLVLDGVLGPGGRLPIEKDLAAQLGVSRGSLREGVRALVHLGVLETRQGDGTYVTALDAGRLLSPLGFLAELPTPGNSAQLLSVRRVLEAESAALAALSIGAEELDAL